MPSFRLLYYTCFVSQTVASCVCQLLLKNMMIVIMMMMRFVVKKTP